MKSNTETLITLGAIGLGAYFLIKIIKPVQDTAESVGGGIGAAASGVGGFVGDAGKTGSSILNIFKTTADGITDSIKDSFAEQDTYKIIPSEAQIIEDITKKAIDSPAVKIIGGSFPGGVAAIDTGLFLGSQIVKSLSHSSGKAANLNNIVRGNSLSIAKQKAADRLITSPTTQAASRYIPLNTSPKSIMDSFRASQQNRKSILFTG